MTKRDFKEKNLKRDARAKGCSGAIGKVVKFETVRQLKKPSFWIALLLFPLLILGMVGVSALNSYNAEQTATGDRSGDKVLALDDETGIFRGKLCEELICFSDAETGILAVKNKEVDIFYQIPADFLENPTISTYSRTEDSSLVTTNDRPLRAMLGAIAGAETEPVNALILTNNYKFTEVMFNTEGEEQNLLGQAILPLAILAVFFILVCVFGNRLLMTVVEEKENRISEMILTAISARELIIGKIIALILLGFVQIIVFILPIAAAVCIYRDNEIIQYVLGIIETNPLTIITNILLLIFSYFFFAGLCTFVGALCPTARDASNYIGPVIIGTMLPFYLISEFMQETPGIIAYVLSYFPLSAPTGLMLRNAFGTLGWQELMIGLVEISALSGVMVRLTVKTFQKNAINFSVVKPNLKPKRGWK